MKSTYILSANKKHIDINNDSSNIFQQCVSGNGDSNQKTFLFVQFIKLSVNLKAFLFTSIK